MPNQDIYRTVVICGKCGTQAPFDQPTPTYPWPRFHIENPCPRCGARKWYAHDTDRDWKTGRLLN